MNDITRIGTAARDAQTRVRRAALLRLREDSHGAAVAAHANGAGQVEHFSDAEHKHHIDVAHHWTSGDDGAKSIVLKAWGHIHAKHGAGVVRKMKSFIAAHKHFQDHPPGAHPNNTRREDTPTASAPGIAAMDLVAGDLGMSGDGN